MSKVDHSISSRISEGGKAWTTGKISIANQKIRSVLLTLPGILRICSDYGVWLKTAAIFAVPAGALPKTRRTCVALRNCRQLRRL
jgi:hypothetical protein